jgi:hypothetical protein
LSRTAFTGRTLKVLAGKAKDDAERARLEVQAASLKLVLNAAFGQFGNPYSSLFDPTALLAVTLSGQLLLIDLIERSTAAGVRVLSANTHGLFLGVDRRGDQWLEVLDACEETTGMRLVSERLKRIAILATNNFAYKNAKGKIKRRGSKLKGELSPMAAPNALVIADAVVNALLQDLPPERTVWGTKNPVPDIFRSGLPSGVSPAWDVRPWDQAGRHPSILVPRSHLTRVSPSWFAWTIRPDPTSRAVSQPPRQESVSITFRKPRSRTSPEV